MGRVDITAVVAAGGCFTALITIAAQYYIPALSRVNS